MDPTSQPVSGSLEPIEGRCASRLRNTDPRRYCMKMPLPARPRCELHGGLSLMGVDATSFKDGSRSKYLPARLQERYEQFVADPKALAMGQDLALLDVRLSELLQRLEDGESEAGWKRAKDAYGDLRGAMAEGDSEGIRSAMGRLAAALKASNNIESTWRDVRELLQERRLVAESERRRLVDLHQMITLEELMLFMAKLTSVIQAEVTDTRARIRIGVAINAMLNRPGAVRTVASKARPSRRENATYSGGVRINGTAEAIDDDGQPIS